MFTTAIGVLIEICSNLLVLLNYPAYKAALKQLERANYDVSLDFQIPETCKRKAVYTRMLYNTAIKSGHLDPYSVNRLDNIRGLSTSLFLLGLDTFRVFFSLNKYYIIISIVLCLFSLWWFWVEYFKQWQFIFARKADRS